MRGFTLADMIRRVREYKDEYSLRRTGRSVAVRHVWINQRAGDELKSLCDHYGSDKGSMRSTSMSTGHAPHSYCDVYGTLFGHCRETVHYVFECGIGTTDPAKASTMGISGRPGASLRVWRDYFPNAKVFGADVDPGTLFSENRIETYEVDQTSSSSIQNLWKRLPGVEFDLFVDDGLHTFEAARCLFENSWDRVALGGLYVVEDLWAEDLLRFIEHVESKGLPHLIVRSLRPGRSVVSDNSLAIIRKPH